MRSNFLLAGLLLTGCIDTTPDDSVPSSDDDLDLRTGNPVVEHDDTFGDVMVSADFNGDGYMDLAVSATGETVGGMANAGAVLIYLGSATGLATGPAQAFTAPDFGGTVHANDRFGASLAARDMTADGCAELVIGAPGYWAVNTSGVAKQESGAVFTLTGVKKVPQVPLAPLAVGKLITEHTAGVTIEAFDHFGSAVAMGKYNGTDNLVAIGASGETPSSGIPTGWLTTMKWGAAGALTMPQYISPPAGTLSGAQFGASLLTLDYDNNGTDDLAVAAPLDFDGGKVYVYKQTSSGLGATPKVIGGIATNAYGFGTAMAVGKFHSQGNELAISLPNASGGTQFFPGEVLIYVWSSSLGQFSTVETLTPSTVLPIRFGSSLAAGKIDTLSGDDLLIGAPNGAGQAFIYKGTANGTTPMTSPGSLTIHAESYSTGTNQGYGSSVALGQFHGTGPLDLAVGAPHATVNSIPNAGLFDEYVGNGGVPTTEKTHVE